jgi:hypothetical protein
MLLWLNDRLHTETTSRFSNRQLPDETDAEVSKEVPTGNGLFEGKMVFIPTLNRCFRKTSLTARDEVGNVARFLWLN